MYLFFILNRHLLGFFFLTVQFLALFPALKNYDCIDLWEGLSSNIKALRTDTCQKNLCIQCGSAVSQSGKSVDQRINCIIHSTLCCIIQGEHSLIIFIVQDTLKTDSFLISGDFVIWTPLLSCSFCQFIYILSIKSFSASVSSIHFHCLHKGEKETLFMFVPKTQRYVFRIYLLNPV